MIYAVLFYLKTSDGGSVMKGLRVDTTGPYPDKRVLSIATQIYTGTQIAKMPPAEAERFDPKHPVIEEEQLVEWIREGMRWDYPWSKLTARKRPTPRGPIIPLKRKLNAG